MSSRRQRRLSSAAINVRRYNPKNRSAIPERLGSTRASRALFPFETDPRSADINVSYSALRVLFVDMHFPVDAHVFATYTTCSADPSTLLNM